MTHEVGDARAFEACELYFGGARVELRLHIVEINVIAGMRIALYSPQVLLG
jgi:hypothetical protein